MQSMSMFYRWKILCNSCLRSKTRDARFGVDKA
jgi:hypothetical protein